MASAKSWRRATVCLLAALLASGCATLGREIQQPELALEEVALREIGLLSQRFELTLAVRNPNGFALPIKRLGYDIEIAGERFADGQTTERFRVPAHGTARTTVEVTTRLGSLLAQMERWLREPQERVDYRLSGTIEPDLFGAGVIRFTEQGSVPLRQ